jgi:hypothetical protein
MILVVPNHPFKGVRHTRPAHGGLLKQPMTLDATIMYTRAYEQRNPPQLTPPLSARSSSAAHRHTLQDLHNPVHQHRRQF